ncbi:MAG: HlyD family efflux transporter periplasmic adaptor subunit [Chitinophagales bacterium]
MTKYFVFIGIIIVAFLGTAWFLYQKGQEKPVVYESVAPETINIVKKTVATGSILPVKEVALKSQVPGVIKEIYVEAGEQVTVGQKIAKIQLIPSPANINNAQASIEQLQIRVKEAEQELSRQKSLNTSGNDVRDAQAAYDQAIRERDQQKPLFDEGIISKQEYDRLSTAVEQARATLEQSKVGASRNVNSYSTDLEIRRAELKSAKDNLQILREGAASRSKEVSNVITSTMTGMVLDIPLKEGSFVIEANSFNEGSTIASIADMNELEFQGQVAESEVGKLKEGIPLEITIGAIEGKKFDAVLNYISPKGIEVDGSIQFEIKATVQTPKDDFIRAGYSANADIILDKRDSVLAINERDLLFSNDSTFVEKEMGEQEFEKVYIETGLSDGINIEVKSGIGKTDKIKKQEQGG